MHARYARFSRLLHFVGLLALAGLILASGARNTQARLDPYYVLRGLGSGDVRPRILFVVDTSGSMSWRATAADQQCDWGDCETRTDTRESRISAARRTINNVISATGETASFSLMSFDQYDPPTWTPTKCANDHRFAWVTDYGYFWWNTIWTYPGIRGAWRLCQGSQQRPYPYLRWDDLGRFATVNANHQSGDIPASPLIGSNANDSSNADRRVQWFPRFMGVRAQLNADTDSDRRILGETYGDYGSDDTSRGSNVWGHDFYYWPYVDGFPHYAGYVLWRGNVAVEELSDRDAWDEVCATNDWITVAFDGGHGVMYPIPELDAEGTGKLRVNWAIYAPTPSALALHGPSSIPPGMVDDACYAQYQALLDQSMPAKFRPLFQVRQEQLSIQPIYDETVDHYTAGRIALIGDAATLTRPHTGSGATKAMQDARLIEELGAEHRNWAPLLDAYDADRSAVGATLVDLGRRIGRDQVEQTPPWADMTPADFNAWAAGTLGGEQLYFWGADEPEPTAR